MRIGYNAEFPQAERIKKAGFDYFETGLYQIMPMSDKEFKKNADLLEKIDLRAEVLNVVFDGTIPIVGQNADLNAARQFIQRELVRANVLGTEIIVFGSGWVRKCPDDFDKERCKAQIYDIIRMMSDEFAKYDITLVLEHLRPKETNMITTFKEELEIVKDINLPNVKALVDFFHLYQAGENLDDVKASGGLIKHAHIARVDDSRAIVTEQDLPDVKDFKAALDACSYDGRISVEAATGDFESDIDSCFKAMSYFKK